MTTTRTARSTTRTARSTTRSASRRRLSRARLEALRAARLDQAVARFRDTGAHTGDALRYTYGQTRKRIEALEAEIAADPQAETVPTQQAYLAYWRQIIHEQENGLY
ncbi:hypothetical protein [Kocuria palustris]|uniref:hypothetical protein n=1 Tax=Kocuria palustris TaxID=71999 RepID=UPI0020448FED|nr:hypothetical protein [Kocuria palustris]MCM3332825.1 hypothetical protein [Kocuria palustris]